MSRIQVSLRLRFLRIPTKWTAETKKVPGPIGPVGVAMPAWVEQRYFIPAVDQSAVPEIREVDGWEWRRRFLQMKRNETSALQVLNQVGVWRAVSEHSISRETGRDRLISGAFGSRYFSGRAIAIEVESLWRDQQTWLDLLRDTKELKRQFGPPPASHSRPLDKLRYAVDTQILNELPLHIEWEKGLPTGVIDCITGFEAIVAMTHFELLQGAKYRNCKNCGIPFAITAKYGKIFCGYSCAHAVASRKSRKKKKTEARRNGDL